jgi:hypothetical protein
MAGKCMSRGFCADNAPTGMAITVNMDSQPPCTAQRLTALYPSPIAAVTGDFDDLSNVWAYAFLVGSEGEVVTGALKGKTAVSPTYSVDHATGYFEFDDLTILTSGTYYLRIDLLRMDIDRAVTVGQIYTRRVEVQ